MSSDGRSIFSCKRRDSARRSSRARICAPLIERGGGGGGRKPMRRRALTAMRAGARKRIHLSIEMSPLCASMSIWPPNSSSP